MNYTISNLTLNQKASFTKTISESDVYLFAGITGDVNPAHINAIYAQNTRFKHRIVHGALLSGLISAVIGVHLPGSGTIYVAQNVKFLSPVYFGDTITATVEVIEIDKEKNRVKLKTTCENQDGLLVVNGEANVMPPL